MSGTSTERRIYVACLASYNNGTLHGEWIDATQGEEAIGEAVKAMLAASPSPGAEEWAIHDYDGFEDLDLGEHASFEEIARHAEMLEKHGEAWAGFCGDRGNDSTAGQFEEAFAGLWGSEEDFARDLAENIDLFRKSTPDALKNYFDWQSWTRDLFLSDYCSLYASDGGVYVFRHI